MCEVGFNTKLGFDAQGRFSQASMVLKFKPGIQSHGEKFLACISQHLALARGSVQLKIQFQAFKFQAWECTFRDKEWA